MSDSIRYKINVEPREELTDEQGNTKNVISGEVGKRLGGSGVAVVTDYAGGNSAQGYKDGSVYYQEIHDSTYNQSTGGGAEITASFMFIKNTGHTYSSATVLGEPLNKALGVYLNPGTTTISILDPGECLVFKDDNAGIDPTDIVLRTVDLDGSENASAGHLALEFLVVD